MLRMTGIGYAQDEETQDDEECRMTERHQTTGNSEILKVVHP